MAPKTDRHQIVSALRSTSGYGAPSAGSSPGWTSRGTGVTGRGVTVRGGCTPPRTGGFPGSCRGRCRGLSAATSAGRRRLGRPELAGRCVDPGEGRVPPEQLERLEQRRRDLASGDGDPERAERVPRLEHEGGDEGRPPR